jgi:2'-5' RNA ligase
MAGRPVNAPAAAALRLFIALAVPEAVKEEILRVREQFRRVLPEGCARWTPPEQWHLTLKFLGEVDGARVDALTEAVRAAGRQFAPLRLRAVGAGCFPDGRFPRVVWIGVRDETDRLAALARAIETVTADFTAAAREGPFTGHITLARIKRLNRPQAEGLASLTGRMSARVFGEWTADGVAILRSELAAVGARHTCLAWMPLGGTAEQGMG